MNAATDACHHGVRCDWMSATVSHVQILMFDLNTMPRLSKSALFDRLAAMPHPATPLE